MDPDAVAALRADVAALRGEVTDMRQDIGALEAKADSFEAWRVRYLVQEDQLIDKLFLKIDELVASLGDMRADISRIRGERDAERRASMMLISVLSAACGGLIAHLLQG
jgi:predicted RNase H-like nuclease (RuvC/YqgF family)